MGTPCLRFLLHINKIIHKVYVNLNKTPFYHGTSLRELYGTHLT